MEFPAKDLMQTRESGWVSRQLYVTEAGPSTGDGSGAVDRGVFLFIECEIGSS
jgi:hypothetical protein